MNTSMIYQGEYMDIKMGSFQIPIASLSLLDTLGVLLLIPIMDKLIYPLLARCFDFHPSQLQRIGVGMLVATASMLCAGGLELYRVEHCCMPQHREGDKDDIHVANITIFYQIPQYTLIGLSEVFTSITGMCNFNFVHVF
jgi:peptide/histidine transporter 3/4